MSTIDRIKAIAAAAILVVLMTGAPANADTVAPAATDAQVAACTTQQKSDAQTAEIAQQVYGVVHMGGCIADDATGIAHAYLEWQHGNKSGRVCTDPVVFEIAWSCDWNTAGLPRGSYTLRFYAVDGVGNRGHFDRKYELVKPPAQASPRPDSPADGNPSPDRDAAPTTPSPDAAPDTVPTPGQNSGPETATEASPDDSAEEATNTPTVEQLALQRIDECNTGAVADTPTNDPDVVSQVDQAAAVRDCMLPALQQLEIARGDVNVNAIPVPPTVDIVADDADELQRLTELIPAQVAGVPVRIELRPTPLSQPLAP